jgi:fatty-acyl-CoA synthase
MPLPLTPVRCVLQARQNYGRRVGVVCGGKEFTYTQFAERCERLCAALGKLGIVEGDRVAWLSYNTHKLLEGYFGVPMAQAVAMPLNVRFSATELIGILRHSGAKVLFFEQEFSPIVARLREECEELSICVALDGPDAQADHDYETLLVSVTPETPDWQSIDENAVAEIFYTSGSTGTPKGVMLTHRALYLHGMSVALLMAGHPDLVDLHTIPLFHANGWGHPQASTMLGGRQVMVRRFEAALVFQLIQQHRATDMAMVPLMVNLLINAPERSNYDLSSLRQIMIGGAAASPELIERAEAALGCEVFGGYGLTESCPVLTTARQRPGQLYESEEQRFAYQAKAGWAIAGVELRVVDNESIDVPRDNHTLGEIVARGDNLMEGYFREPEQTAAVLCDGWLRTGDMAVWDEDGVINIVDRRKEIIISGGENISSLELERVIFAHEDVLECAVVAAPDERWGEVPAAFVVLKPGRKVSEAALLAWMEARLARFKLPRSIRIQTEALPRTGTGKVRKRELREPLWQGKERRVQG